MHNHASGDSLFAVSKVGLFTDSTVHPRLLSSCFKTVHHVLADIYRLKGPSYARATRDNQVHCLVNFEVRD